MSKFVSLLVVAVATISTTKFDHPPDPLTALAQPGCIIKGNISMNTGRKLYHIPGMKDYERTIVNQGKGERWFCTEPEAIDSGWIRAPR
jgi:hypothetical protein